MVPKTKSMLSISTKYSWKNNSFTKWWNLSFWSMEVLKRISGVWSAKTAQIKKQINHIITLRSLQRTKELETKNKVCQKKDKHKQRTNQEYTKWSLCPPVILPCLILPFVFLTLSPLAILVCLLSNLSFLYFNFWPFGCL